MQKSSSSLIMLYLFDIRLDIGHFHLGNKESFFLNTNFKKSMSNFQYIFSSGEADYTTAFLPSSHVPAFMSRMTHVMNFKER